MKKVFFCLVLSLFALLPLAKASDDLAALRQVAIQDGGRIKPLDTFVRESLALIHGKENFEGKPALQVVMTWFLDGKAWEDKELIEIRYGLLKQALKFPLERKYFTLQEILSSDRLSFVFQELQSQREAKIKLNPYFQAVQRLESQLGLFRGIASGELLRLVPPQDPEQSLWLAPLQWSADQQKNFAQITKVFVGIITASAASPELAAQMDQAVAAFVNSVKGSGEAAVAAYPDATKLKTEIFYNQFHPFQKAWIFYFLALLTLLLQWILKRPFLYKVSWFGAGIGLIFHIMGFVLRVYLTGRPPVSNMYETVTWVSFGALIFSMIIEYIYRWRFILFAGLAVAGFCLLLTDLSPVILDPSLQPLEAVLNSNFWLTTHVLTITVSYAAFFLAFALGDLGLFFYAKGDTDKSPRLQAITLSIYRAIQIGVSLLAPGIILGGIWADYSWGRFWGWDPKETWALIALLGYIAVLHARMAGLVRGFGMVACSVVAFSLVIMAWYGVNFVLGAGLHSYGFGAGGVEYVATFVGVHLLAVIFVSVLHHSRKTSLKN